MPLFSWLKSKSPPSSPTEAGLEQQMDRLEKQLRELLDARAPLHPVHIEHLHIEKAVIEHIEYNSNIGDLSVDELTGKLNIGANYFGPIPEQLYDKFASGKPKPKLKMNGKPLEDTAGGTSSAD